MSDQTYDPQLGSLLRAVLKAEAASLPLTVVPEQILERGRARNRGRLGSGLQIPRLMAAAGTAVVLVVAVAAVGMYLNRHGIGVEPSPTPSRSLSPSPSPAEAVVTGILSDFLAARVAGEGAGQYLAIPENEVPLLYATTSGDPYERTEFEQ